MDLGEERNRPRMVGDYIIGPRIGWGSFAVVWRSKHRWLGTEFAIKEIDKKHLNASMMKEISILRQINHPNIVRLFESIETEDRIFLVLEYCGGGDLGAYLHRHGRVSADVARHFMRQLAAGLQVLRDNNLIHRDLKPQNLLLTSKDVTPSLKIGDFGFARYLTPQDLAATLCGSPLYMAPEIIQNQKYDAKADLWSVGAILFQLVTGRPPYGGNSQLELFQNILSSTELQFPKAALQVLHPDCVELCRKLLRRNPVERLTFEEFFNHKFLAEPRVTEKTEPSAPVSNDEPLAERTECSRDIERHLSCASSSVEKNVLLAKDHCIADSMELIEWEYVLVNSHFASMESLTSSLERTMIDSSGGRACGVKPETDTHVVAQTKEVAASSAGGIGKTFSSSTSSVSTERQGIGSVHHLTRLQLLSQFARALSAFAQEKLDAGSLVDAVSIELAVLAIWEEIIEISSSNSSSFSQSTEMTGNPQIAGSSSNTKETCHEWAKCGFINALERAEKLAKHLHETDGTAVVPNAIELIYEAALAYGRSAAVDELFKNLDGAAMRYSKAMVLLSFIVSEAPLLSLKPRFSLQPEDKKRIMNYIRCMEAHMNRLRASQSHVTTRVMRSYGYAAPEYIATGTF
ncbi:hypothetical protein V2J09_013905 [Rumex salicifolius]